MIDAKKIRKRILELALNAGSNGAHLGGALSCVEILCSIYDEIDVNDKSESRDRVILSKGHGALALYCVLEAVGVMTKEDIDTFETNGTHIFAHASRNIEKGIEFSGGSLGLGISFAAGVALACKGKQLNNHIYIIVGDGECDEGIFWETLETINKYKLDNITIIVDCNAVQADGPTVEVMDLTSMTEKFKAFNIPAEDVDGHSIEALKEAIFMPNNEAARAIVAHTVKGKGVSFMENTAAWHHGIVNQKKFDKAMSELNAE
jgi:transketolase